MVASEGLLELLLLDAVTAFIGLSFTVLTTWAGHCFLRSMGP
jgi:hypothetical protein